MIRIEYNTANLVAISLDEFTTTPNPYYLFEIYSEVQNKIVKTFVSPDTATAENKIRFNAFTFTEVGQGGVEDLYVGKIRLENNGTYLLNSYLNTSSGNLSKVGLSLLCSEVLKVYGNPDGNFLEYDGNDKTFLEYDFED